MSPHYNNQDDRLDWYNNSNLGRYLLEAENQLLDKTLPLLFGYYLLQLGPFKTQYNLKTNRTLTTLYQHKQVTPNSKADLYSLYTQMPYANASIDTVFLPHIVEDETDIVQLLQESVRVLVPDGYLIITGFNPRSLLGIGNLIKRRRHKLPLPKGWTIHQLCKQLYALDADIITVNSCLFGPVLKNRRWRTRLSFLEILGRLCFPKMGSIYVIVAQKKLIPLAPIKLNWKRQLSSFGNEIASPSTRSCNRDKTC